MEVSGVNINTAKFNIDKKVYYPFLETPLDKVQISSQDSDQKSDTQNQEIKDLLNPKKNYKKLVATIASIAGASVLIAGLTIAALFRGKSGLSEKMGSYLQKQRGKIYSLQHETSIWADIRLKIRTKFVNFFDKGLTTWTNTEQFRNRLFDQKIIEKMGIFNRPIRWVITKFENAAKATSKEKYIKCVEKAKKFQELLPKLKEIAPEKATKIEENVNEIIKKTEDLLNNFDERQKEIDSILEKIAKDYDKQHKLLSEKGGFIEVFKHIFHDAKGLATSGDNITSRKNLEELKAKKAELYKKKEEISRNVKDNYKRNMELLRQAEEAVIEVSKNNKTLENRYTHDFFNSFRIFEGTMKAYKNSETIRGINSRKTNKKLFIEDADKMIKVLEDCQFGKFDRAVENLEKAKSRIGKEDEKGLVEKLRMLLKDYDYKTGENITKDNNEELYRIFKKAGDDLSESLNNAVKFESDNLAFRKMDLKLGGGNFEVLGLSIPVALGINSVVKADSHDERVSKGIRTGSVIGGGLIGWIFSSVIMCWSAGQAIVFALASGLTFDKVGKFIDNQFWSHGRDWNAKKQKQQTPVDHKA